MASGEITDKLARCNYQYGHILVCVVQGRITDEKALSERFDALEEKIEGLCEEWGQFFGSVLTPTFDREAVPPVASYDKQAPWMHRPFYPVTFINDMDQDISNKFMIKL